MWKKRPYDIKIESKLRESGRPKFFSRLLAQRNINADQVDTFIESSYEKISHPYKLKGVKEASKIFHDIAHKKGRVAVSGDYDADGIISSVMIKELCNVFNIECNVFLPSRLDHGYGLTEKSLKAFKDFIKEDPDLLIIVDSGSNSEEEVKQLKTWYPNMKVIIIDHHIIDTDKMAKSADVLINWHLQDDYIETCACGEVFQFIRGIRWLTKKVNPIEFISYAAIGILADVSPIIGDNRIIVKNGLQQYSLDHIVASGLTALVKKSYILPPDISQEDVLFKIAPKINAVGRLHKPDFAFKLLTEHDPSLSEAMAERLGDYNSQRKKLQKDMVKEAVSMVESNIEHFKNGVLIVNPKWSVGIVGIVASKLVEKFGLPAIVISKSGDTWKGSGRSLENINLKEILDDCNHIFDGYGGHALAAGVTVKEDCLEKANKIFNEACGRYYKKHGRPSGIKYYDVELKPKDVSTKLFQFLIDTFYPYCSQHNPEPVFRITGGTITDTKCETKSGWSIMTFKIEKDGLKTDFNFKTFDEKLGTEIDGKKVDIYFTMPQSVNTKNKPSVNVIEIIPL